MGFSKTLDVIRSGVTRAWIKLARPTVRRGGTAWPQTDRDLERYGVRFDYDGTVEREDGRYHKFQMQPNAGKIPTSIARWMKENKASTHAVMADVYIKEGATEAEVEEAVDTALQAI